MPLDRRVQRTSWAEREDSTQDKELDMYMGIIWGRIASAQMLGIQLAFGTTKQT